MIYLSGVSSKLLRASLPHDQLGLMWTRASWRGAQHIPGAIWAADNGCYSEFIGGEPFEPGRWLSWLESMDRTGCLFAVAPDRVGDAAGTLARSTPYFGSLRQRGYRVAFVLQNGQEDRPMPWGSIDAVFIGGDTKWKMSSHACALAYEAKDRGKWVHMGRVNSEKRMRRAAEMGCDSVDGTFLRFGPPQQQLDRVLSWIKSLNHRPVLDLNL